MKTLKQFQEKKVEELLDNSKKILEDGDDNNLLIFQSPTGSGKTFTMTKFIEKLVAWGNQDDVNQDLCFLWVSIGKGNLEEQSYHSLKENLEEETKVLRLDEVQNKEHLNSGDVVVFNWEKIRSKDNKGEWKNIAMKDNEKGNFIDCLKETKENKKIKIILIIDESHSNAKSERAEELRKEVINANLAIEVSATPILEEYKTLIKVKTDDVVKEEMIKKEIIINEEIKEGDSVTALLESAYSKREELKQLYEKNEIEINPLCLIQLPIKKHDEDNLFSLQNEITNFLSNKNVKTSNGKLAIHLSDEKINNEQFILSQNQNEVEFLIFKQAIDTGWDCPRAQILMKFRETGNIVFEIQTLGRILRMPEQKYYQEEELNRSYVYTNDDNYKILKEEYNPNITKKFGGKRKEIYKQLNLKSFYKKRVDFGDVERDLYKGKEKSIFFQEFSKHIGKNKKEIDQNLNLDFDKQAEKIILNETIDSKNIDDFKKENNLSNFKNIELAEIYLENLYNNLIIKNLNGFAPKRSLSTIKEAIKLFFKNKLEINLLDNGLVFIKNICLNNFDKISDALDKTLKIYKKYKEEKNKEEEKNAWEEYNWNIKENYYYNPHTYEEKNYKKFIFDKCFIKFDSSLEEEFIEEKLEKDENIIWWWKNGSEHLKDNFGIKYEKENKFSNFQPDFIVYFKNHSIGIYDTKARERDKDDTKLKAEALQKYIKNQKNKKLIGGIVINEHNNWRINKKDNYNWNNLGDFEVLTFN